MTASDEPEGDPLEGFEEEYVEKLERYRRRLDGAMLAGDLAWWEMDVETGVVEFHEQKANLLDIPPEEFDHYEDFTERIHEDDYEDAMQAMRDHLEGRAEKYDIEYRIRTADGDYIWFHDIGGVTKVADDGTPLKATGIVVDVTRRKETQRELRRRNEQLSLLNRILRHDISNDMNIISGWSEVLAEELSDEQQDTLERIRRASEHTAQLTADVRDLLTLLEGEEEGLDLEPTNLPRVVRAEVGRVRQSFDGVEIHVPDELPDVDVEANGMLNSVVGNLLNNAVQHHDEEVARIDIAVEAGADTVTLTVADNGPGIPPEQQDDIFQREAKGPDSEGIGLGLYLVNTLVTAYGGSVQFAENDPTGAVFTVELRRA